jgi:hypothetical protein
MFISVHYLIRATWSAQFVHLDLITRVVESDKWMNEWMNESVSEFWALLELYRREDKNALGRTCPITTYTPANPTWNGLGSNPGLCGERQVTNRLKHDTAAECTLDWFMFQRNRMVLRVRGFGINSEFKQFIIVTGLWEDQRRDDDFNTVSCARRLRL